MFQPYAAGKETSGFKDITASGNASLAYGTGIQVIMKNPSAFSYSVVNQNGYSIDTTCPISPEYPSSTYSAFCVGPMDDGTNVFTVYAMDAASNVVDTKTFSLSVDTQSPVIVSV